MADETEPADATLEAVVRQLRAPVAPRSLAAERALDALRRARWSWRAGWAVAAGVVLAALWMARGDDPAVRPVRFALRAPATARVALIGDFNDWDPHRSQLRAAAGEWAVTLRLPPGRYRYSFVVDGSRWVADPVRISTDDDFDTPTSVVTVGR